MKRNKTLDFLTVTLFFGVVLTFTVYMGITTVFETDGKSGGKTRTFNDIFYGDSFVGDIVKFIDYRIFGHIEGDNIVIGEDEWLFEAIDSQNGYERLLDYIGGCQFSDEELARISEVISERQALYEQSGIEYMLVVIPDSITVGEDYVPWYLGRQSDMTRLSQLTRYLEDRGVTSFVNPTAEMKTDKKSLPSVNNTENSINAYGAYCIYNRVMTAFAKSSGRSFDIIQRENVNFYTRITDGKEIAIRAGLEAAAKNRTVSLSDNFDDVYTTLYNEKGYVITERADVIDLGGDRVVIECTDDWDRIQLMPYFSNTFDTVYYKNTLNSEPNISEQYGATFVVQIIHESELAMLLKRW